MTTPATTTSPSRAFEAELARITPIIERIAARLAGTSRARQARAEPEDLLQEGLIAAWLSLERGVNPMLTVENRMVDYIRWLSRQPEPVPYEQLLPMEPLGGAA